MSFSYSDFPISDNASHLGNFFQINFVDLVIKLYTLYYFLHNEAVVLKFSYKTINIIYSLSNI